MDFVLLHITLTSSGRHIREQKLPSDDFVPLLFLEVFRFIVELSLLGSNQLSFFDQPVDRNPIFNRMQKAKL